MKTPLFISDIALRKIQMNLLSGNIKFEKLTKEEVINDIPKTVELISDKITNDALEDLRNGGRVEDYIKRKAQTFLYVGQEMYVVKKNTTGNPSCQISYYKVKIS